MVVCEGVVNGFIGLQTVGLLADPLQTLLELSS